MTGSLSSLSSSQGLLRLPAWVSTRNGLSAGVRLLLAGTALTAIFLSSVSLYAMFYRLYVPTLLHQAPVYLQYDTANPANTTAVVNFVPEKNYKFLSTSQAYTVALDLRVPTSDENRKLGNFMVSLELCSGNGVSVHRSSRPGILPYRSKIMWSIRTLVQMPLLLLDWWHEDESLHIDLIDVLYDRHFSPINHARISLSKPLQVYDAFIVIRAHFTGLRYWMYYWRMPTAIVFVAVAVVWQLVFTAVAWSVLESYTGSTSRMLEPDASGAPSHLSTEHSSVVSRSRTRSRSRSGSKSGSRLQPAARSMSLRKRRARSRSEDGQEPQLSPSLTHPRAIDDQHDLPLQQQVPTATPSNPDPASSEHAVPEQRTQS
ncbi:hypothetical protein LPJ57_005377 [Coemansia sp. RSA 486]|nr:hypothetical protein LPJ57_005377 [Coemansia sp. RSA 486]